MPFKLHIASNRSKMSGNLIFHVELLGKLGNLGSLSSWFIPKSRDGFFMTVHAVLTNI